MSTGTVMVSPAANLPARLSMMGRRVEIVTMPCAGAIDAGRLLQIAHRGADRILVAGCQPRHCRYQGARQGAAQIAAARNLLGLVGADPRRISDDWSGDPDHEAIAPELPEIMAAAWVEPGGEAERERGG